MSECVASVNGIIYRTVVLSKVGIGLRSLATPFGGHPPDWPVMRPALRSSSANSANSPNTKPPPGPPQPQPSIATFLLLCLYLHSLLRHSPLHLPTQYLRKSTDADLPRYRSTSSRSHTRYCEQEPHHSAISPSRPSPSLQLVTNCQLLRQDRIFTDLIDHLKTSTADLLTPPRNYRDLIKGLGACARVLHDKIVLPGHKGFAIVVGSSGTTTSTSSAATASVYTHAPSCGLQYYFPPSSCWRPSSPYSQAPPRFD